MDAKRFLLPSIFIGFLVLLENTQVQGAELFSLPTVYQRIYKEVDNIKACFRLLNATHQIGCSATPSNVSGVLWYVESQDNLTSLLDKHPYSPYIVILEPHLFTTPNVLKMKRSKHVTGIVMYYNTSDPIPPGLMAFSPAQTCPNSGFGLDNCKDWNANGSQLTFEDLDDFAIFTITSNDSYQDLLQCFEDHNKGADGGYDDYPLCSAELEASMQAVISTPECYRRAQIWTNLGVPSCVPLGDQNVWGTLFELEDNADVIVVATKLDSSALIPDLAFGANNEVAGIVTQLAVAEALGKLKKDGSLLGMDKQIMFVFFQGESFDYIGSSRMVFDMIRGTFPYERDSKKQQPPLLNITNITSFLELSQVGIQSDSSATTPLYYLHTNNNQSSLYDALQQVNESLSFQSSSTVGQLPSASAQMFLRKSSNIPVVIVTDYDQQFNNKFFGSRYDTLSNLLGEGSNLNPSSPVVTHLTQLASSLAQVLLNVSLPTYSSSSTPPIPQADNNTIAMLLECFLVQNNCTLLRTVLSPDWLGSLTSEPLGRYVTVNTLSNPETEFVFNLMAYFTGMENDTYTTCGQCDSAQSDSNQVYTYTKMSGVNYSPTEKNCTCYKSFTHRHEATSPAFELKDYSSTEYSTWTESYWNGIGMRLYLVTYTLFEVAIFFCGLTLFAVSLLVTWQCSRKSRQIFAVTANAKSVVTDS